MATFTVFNNANRETNVVNSTAEIVVPETGETMVRFILTPADALTNEPPDTIFYWTIEIADGVGLPWRHSAGGSWSGFNGVPPHKPVSIAMSMPPPGSVIRGSMYFVTADGRRRRFGIDGEIY